MGVNVYDVINGRIVELLERGTVPWRKPWNAHSNYPKNLVSKKEYRGVNVFLLASQQFDSSWWLTFNQCQERGGHIMKGAKSTPVIFWKWLNTVDADISEDQGSRIVKIPMLRYYNVFNLEQTEGISAPEPEEISNDHQPLPLPEQIFKNMPLRPELKFGGNRAYYSVNLDYIQLPHISTFDTPEEYHSTLFHEIIHSTGHQSRLARKSILEQSYYGSHEYSKEELVAEMGAAFLCGFSGIEQITIQNSAAYISGWLRSLKNDKTLLVHAASMAQKASDFVLNRSRDEQEAAEA